MASPIKDSKLKPKMPGMPQLIVDPKPGNRVGPNPPGNRVGPNPPKPRLKPGTEKPYPMPGIIDMGPNLPKPRVKPGIPNGLTVSKVYKTY